MGRFGSHGGQSEDRPTRDMWDEISDDYEVTSIQVTDSDHVVEEIGEDVKKMIQETNEEIDGQGIKLLVSENIQKYLDILEELKMPEKKDGTKVTDKLIYIYMLDDIDSCLLKKRQRNGLIATSHKTKPETNVYANGFCKRSVERCGSRFQYYVRALVDHIRTQLFESGDTFDELFNFSMDGDEEAHFLTTGLGNKAQRLPKKN